MHSYGVFCRPALASRLAALTLDAVYVRAEGDYLWEQRGNQTFKTLDLVGGYGANLFGHYHPELVAEERRLTEAKVPLLAQGSIRGGAAQLGEALAKRLGDFLTIFTNSGTEAIEAALKHARLERNRLAIWTVRGAFHGKTLGSIQLTQHYRGPYAGWGPSVRFLDPDDPSDWEAAAADVDQVAAAFIEPVLGEGGIRPLPAPFAHWLDTTRRRAGFPLVADEIQSGLGRTGTFLACESLGIEPDYICLSKSLGGGLAKIGALLVRRRRFQASFALNHTSTFAEDDRGCLLALKGLEILDRDDLPGRCKRLGEYLLGRLTDVWARFPDQIRDVRGRGLMVGVELQDQSESASNTLQTLGRLDFLGYAAAAYLLNVHHIRVAPTLSSPCTLRLEPSAYITEPELDRFVVALESLCLGLRLADASHLTAFQVGHQAPAVRDRRGHRPIVRERPTTPRRVAFIGHLLRPEHALLWDPTLEGVPSELLETYMAKIAPELGPVVFEQVNICSRTGAQVHLSYIGLGFTPDQAIEAIRHRRAGWIVEALEAAVAMARDLGASVVGLGGYTSILTANCQRVKTGGIALTSGNSLTVGMSLTALRKAAALMGIDLTHATCGVFGATGNIASTASILMAPHVASMTLVVRDPQSPRLKALVEQIHARAPSVRVDVATEPERLRACSVILAASNQPQPSIRSDHLGPEPVVVCDISLPPDVAPAVAVERPDVLVVEGGVMKLPANEQFTIAGLPLEPGHVYACLAETLLMGLEGLTTHGTVGPVTPEGVQRAVDMAERHGFRISQFKLHPSLGR